MSPSLAPSEFAELPAEEAIPRLMEEHGGRLFGLGLRLCGSPEDAEELVQEIFLNAFRKWDQFEGRAQPSTWLYSIASHACMRMQRRRAGEPARFDSLSDLIPNESLTVPDLPASDGTPFDDRVQSEIQSAVETALLDVPPDFRIALILKDIADLSLAEIGQILGIKPETVKTRVHRARLAMRKSLADALPQRPLRDPEAQPICLDLLTAKQEAVDRGVPFPVPDEFLSDRCQSFFHTLDLTRQSCRRIGETEIPASTLARMERRILANAQPDPAPI
jgi:RNA polymerase sigma-70 factor (ECF subfamily)